MIFRSIRIAVLCAVGAAAQAQGASSVSPAAPPVRDNSFLVEDDRIVGVADPILGKDAKLATLKAEAQGQGVGLSQTIAVGDGANDLDILKAAGLGVAFHAKPIVAREAAARINHGDLTSLLFLQGYRQTDFLDRF